MKTSVQLLAALGLGMLALSCNTSAKKSEVKQNGIVDIIGNNDEAVDHCYFIASDLPSGLATFTIGWFSAETFQANKICIKTEMPSENEFSFFEITFINQGFDSSEVTWEGTGSVERYSPTDVRFTFNDGEPEPTQYFGSIDANGLLDSFNGHLVYLADDTSNSSEETCYYIANDLIDGIATFTIGWFNAQTFEANTICIKGEKPEVGEYVMFEIKFIIADAIAGTSEVTWKGTGDISRYTPTDAWFTFHDGEPEPTQFAATFNTEGKLTTFKGLDVVAH